MEESPNSDEFCVNEVIDSAEGDNSQALTFDPSTPWTSLLSSEDEQEMQRRMEEIERERAERLKQWEEEQRKRKIIKMKAFALKILLSGEYTEEEMTRKKKRKRKDSYFKLMRNNVSRFNEKFPSNNDDDDELNQIDREHQIERFLSTILSIDFSNWFANLIDRDRPIIESIFSHYQESLIGIDLESKTPTNLPLVYQNLAHFTSIYTPLMILESYGQICRVASEKVLCPPSSSNRCDPICQHFSGKRLEIVESYAGQDPNTFEFHVLFHCNESWEKFRKQAWFRSWLTLVVDSHYKIMTYGLIIWQKFTHQTVDLGQGQSEIFREKSKIILYDVTYGIKFYGRHPNLANAVELWPLCQFSQPIRLIQTMTLLESSPNLINAILKPSLETFTTGNEDQGAINMKQVVYNQAQRKVIKSCHSMVSSRKLTTHFRLIQGPPGTGKTHTLVGIVKALFSGTKTRRIMICAPSNGAVDEIARRLVQELYFRGAKKPLLLVRIGLENKIDAAVKPYWLDGLCKQMTPHFVSYFPYVLTRDELKRRISSAILRVSEVVLCTLGSSQNDSIRRAFSVFRKPIDCLIVDEAAQCSEPELLLPFVYPRISKCILIGDHRQLASTVTSMKAAQYQYGRSMFERFHLHFEEGQAQFPVMMLTEQYRMCPEIIQFPSEQFYGNRLTTALGTGKNKRIPIKPYFVVNLTDTEETSDKSASKSNLAEVSFIIKLLQQIFSLVKLPVSIGIISFYKAQVTLLQDALDICSHLSLTEKNCVTINTVDGYQGQERDIIILSCVRASEPWFVNPNHHRVGFVALDQRMNVALTRAKSALFVVLSGATFAEAPNWKQLILDARARLRYFTYESTVNHNLFSNQILSNIRTAVYDFA